jgi:hypothetical protein
MPWETLGGFYGIGAALTGLRLALRFIPRIRKWLRENPPRTLQDRVGIVFSGFFAVALPLVAGCLLWPATWFFLPRWDMWKTAALDTDTRREVTSLLEEAREERGETAEIPPQSHKR